MVICSTPLFPDVPVCYTDYYDGETTGLFTDGQGTDFMALTGIETKIQLLVILVVLVPALAIGTYLYVESRTILSSLLLEKQEGLFIQLTERVNQLFIGCRNDLEQLVALPLFADYCLNRRYGLNEEASVVKTELEKLFRKMLRRNGAYGCIAFRGKDNEDYLIVTPEGSEKPQLNLCKISTATFAKNNVRFVDVRDQRHSIYAYEARVFNPSSNELLACVTILIRPKSVTDLIKSASSALRGGNYRLVNKEGRTIFGEKTQDTSKPKSAYSYSLINGWKANLDVDYGYLLAPLGNFRKRALWSLAFALVLGLALSTLGARRITEPLIEIGEISTRIAKGDFEPPARQHYAMDFEVQQLWENIHNMASSLKEHQERIEAYITKLKTTQNQLVHAEKLSALGLLVAGVAHELNNPMSGLVSSARVIEKSLARSEPNMDMANKHTGLILIHLQHMQGILKALQDYSRYSEAKPSTSLDINRLVEDALIIIHHQVKRREFSKELRATKPIAGDPVSLKQVIVNLVVNAAEATDVGQGVAVSTWDDTFLNDDVYYTGYSRRSDDSQEYRHRLLNGMVKRTKAEGVEPGKACVCLSVHDDGIGIDENVYLRIFDPFFTTKPEGRGTGLGLSVVLGIVESHGGVIRVESQQSKGTTFVLKFPIVTT